MSRWFHAVNEHSEEYRGPYETREAAIKAGRAEYAAFLGNYADDPDLGHFVVGTGEPLNPAAWLPSADLFIENMKDECAEDESDVDPDAHLFFADGATKALENALAAWCKTYVRCKYCMVNSDLERVPVAPQEGP